MPVTIIPGVEWVSKEKAEVVFLFEDRSSLEPALKTLKPFSHSIWDIGGLGGDLAGLTIIPHPFTPGKTGAGNLLGPDGLLRLLELADYVEIHNGLARQFDELILFGRLKRLPLGLMRRIRDTACLPDRFRPPSLGWSVGSDAHFPGELHMAGQADGIDPDNWFAALRGRLRFAKVDLPTPGFPPGRLAKNFRSLRLVMREAWLKARCK